MISKLLRPRTTDQVLGKFSKLADNLAAHADRQFATSEAHFAKADVLTGKAVLARGDAAKARTIHGKLSALFNG